MLIPPRSSPTPHEMFSGLDAVLEVDVDKREHMIRTRPLDGPMFQTFGHSSVRSHTTRLTSPRRVSTMKLRRETASHKEEIHHARQG